MIRQKRRPAHREKVVRSSQQFHNDTMAPSRLKDPSTVFVYLLLTAFILPSNALYFYINGNQPKCFFEELPKDTMVVGKQADIWLFLQLLPTDV